MVRLTEDKHIVTDGRNIGICATDPVVDASVCPKTRVVDTVVVGIRGICGVKVLLDSCLLIGGRVEYIAESATGGESGHRDFRILSSCAAWREVGATNGGDIRATCGRLRDKDVAITQTIGWCWVTTTSSNPRISRRNDD